MTRYALLLALSFAPDAYASWQKLTSPHFELYTSAGTRSGREALRRLEQIRSVFETRTQQSNLTPLPVRVFLFRSESAFRPFQATENAAGYYAPGVDRDYIAMQAEDTDLYRVVFHEYVHLMMRHAGVHVPVWLNEGTAEVYSTLDVRGDQVRIGDLIPAHIATLRSESVLDLKTLLTVTHDSPHYNERAKLGIFYAQSWALVHMLNLSPEYQSGTPNLISMLAAGEEPGRAFQQAFGKSLTTVRSDLTAYIRQDRFTGVRFPSERTQGFAIAEPVAIPEPDATLLLADLLINIRRAEQADAILARLADRFPEHLGVQEALGDASVRRNDLLVAKTHYDNAIRLGSTSGRLRYDYALVQRQLGMDEAVITVTLKEAIRYDPKLFDAHYLLGYMSLKSERPSEAVAHFRAASELRPLRTAVWEHLALAYHASGNKPQARTAAQKARKLAVSPEDVERTEATLRLVETDNIVKALPPARQEEHREPQWARPASVVHAEGFLVQVDCLDKRARLHILHAAGKLYLLVSDPARVFLRGSRDAFTEFDCGAVSRRPVMVEYRTERNESLGTTGVVTAIEFR